MLRRVCSASLMRPAAPSSLLSALLAASRCQGSAPAAAAGQGQGNNRRQNNNSNFRQPMTQEVRATMPPAFDLPRPNKADYKSGYMLRVSFNEAVIFTYFKQQAPPTEGTPRRSKSNYQQAALVGLPSMYVARLLAVIDGKLSSCQVNSRMTRGTFSAQGNGTFLLDCVSTVQAGTEPVSWKVEFDVPSTVLLERFLKLSLQQMQGFFQ